MAQKRLKSPLIAIESNDNLTFLFLQNGEKNICGRFLLNLVSSELYVAEIQS